MPVPELFEEDTRPKKEFRVLAAACYIPLGFVLPYATDRSGDPFVRFHLQQGLGMFGVFLLCSILGIGGFAIFVYLILGAITGYQAYLGEMYMMGWIKFLVEKFKSFTK